MFLSLILSLLSNLMLLFCRLLKDLAKVCVHLGHGLGILLDNISLIFFKLFEVRAANHFFGLCLVNL
jgi:hypothetical protein